MRAVFRGADGERGGGMMHDLLGRLVEYNTGRRDRRDFCIWDAGTVRAVSRVNLASWEVLIEEHDGSLITSRHDEVRLIDESRARDLRRNRNRRNRRRVRR